ncbi:unnamed protein product, partial [Polarella glacialis]
QSAILSDTWWPAWLKRPSPGVRRVSSHGWRDWGASWGHQQAWPIIPPAEPRRRFWSRKTLFGTLQLSST